MKRRFLAFISLFAVPVTVLGLGLGEIELNSGLNQPFDARIRLLSPTANDLNSLKVNLADINAFRRAGIDRPFILSKLRFEIQVNESGSDYIRVTSRESIREPYLNFLVEANWSNGRLFREYTVLLDPPLYDPNARAITTEAPVITAPVDEETYEVPEEVEPAVSTPAVITGTFAGNEYGPVASGETLWSIASRVRPDSTVSIQQMMMALLRSNPEAFINNNINGLKRGHVLRIPDQNEISSLSKSDALNQVKTQYAAWDDLRGITATAPAERPVSTTEVPVEEAPVIETPVEEETSELRLVAPSEEGTGGEEGVSGAATEEKLGNEIALANEQLAALTAENAELEDRLSESETIIADLKRLIELKDDELATLQEQLAMTPAAGEVMEEATEIDGTGTEEETVAEEEITEPEPAVEESTPVAEKPEPVKPQPVVSPAKGIVDQVLGFVTGNLMIIGGAAGGLVLIIIVLLLLSKIKGGMGADEAVTISAEEFPDFASEDETEIPGGGTEDVTDIKVADEGGAEKSEDEEEATIFIDQSETAEAETAEPQETPEEAAPATEEPEEDPLAEVNVFLAYEHFDQAEEFVRDAIAKDPDNLEFHSKLLEVFYASGEKAKYEEAAKVLHDIVNGEGSHWDMAVAMWQELSPNRALFETPVEGEDDEKAETTGGGIVDLTADASENNESIDFDLGSETVSEKPESDEDVLDISTGAEEAPSSLDLTAASSPEDNDGILDLTAAASVDEAPDEKPEEDEDVLDVTAAVGLDMDEAENGGADSSAEDDLLNITGSESVSGEGDVLDVTGSGISGDDLLDVTSHHGDFKDEEMAEDLLDVTSATRASANSDELLEVGSDDENKDESESGDEDNSLDFDIGGIEEAPVPPSEEKTEEVSLSDIDNNVIDFDSASGSADSGSDDDGGIELDLSSDDVDSGDEGGGLEGDLSIDVEGLSLDTGDDADEGLSLDNGDDNGMEFELSLDEDNSASDIEDSTAQEVPSLDLEIEADADSGSDDSVPDLDMDSTVEIPPSALNLAESDDEDDDDEDSTVFVPRSSATQEQSIDDEIATKLDLAKAYVELGDKDSAKSILDEVISAGNEEQKKIAQDLMGQVS